MKKIVFAIFLLTTSLYSQTAALNGYCNLGASKALTSGLSSSNYQQGLIPSCTVTVYLTGTTTLATIYSDSSSTSLSNPFTANTDASWLFFSSVDQGYDVVLSGGVSPNVYTTSVTLTGLYPTNDLSVSCTALGCVSTTITTNQTMAGSLTLPDLITKNTPVEDVRAYGAKCDGSTNDQSAINTALATSGRHIILIPSGLTCLSEGALYIPGTTAGTSGNSLEVEGTLQLSASISTPFLNIGSATVGPAVNISIFGTGIIDANYLAPVIISGVNYSSVWLAVQQVRNGTLFGVVGGDTTATCTATHCYHAQFNIGGGTNILLQNIASAGSGTWGNCSTSITLPSPFTSLTTAAAGICMDAGTDNTIDESVLTIGYPVGASIHSGDNRISFHPWAATYSPDTGNMQIGIDDYASGTQISNCYIDTPQVFGIYEHEYNAVIDNCTFFELAGFAPTNTAYGVYFAIASPYASVTNSRFKGGTGSYFAYDVAGVGSLDTVARSGNVVSGGVTISYAAISNAITNSIFQSNVDISGSLNLDYSGTVHWEQYTDSNFYFHVHSVDDALDHLEFFPSGSNVFNVPTGQFHTFNVNASQVASIGLAGSSFANPTDAVYQMKIGAGSTATQDVSLAFVDRGTTEWVLDKDTSNVFRLHDQIGGNDRLIMYPSGYTNFNVLTGQGYNFNVGGTESIQISSGGLSNLNGTLLPSTFTGNAGNSTGKVVGVLTGTTGSIGGSALAAGACATGTATLTASATGHTGTAAASDGTVQGNYVPEVSVSGTTATVSVCAITAGTPTAKTYTVTVF